MDKASSSKTIAKNTVFLYIRMLLTMAVSLYTSRIVLRTLGVDDFGIFSVVGGLVSMSSLLTATMSVTISRFLTFELGRGDFSKLEKVFSTSINIQILLSVIIVLLSETAGLWFLNEKMLIPDDRTTAANWVFQCSLLSFVVKLLSTPYNSLLIAHERMSWYAYFSIIEVLLKLIIVYSLVLLPWDNLYVYASLLALVSIIMRLIYAIYCKKRFEECKYRPVFDKNLLVEMGSFAGWNNFGAIAFILRTQGINILMNLFFGVAVNAARAIATQVEAAVNQFVSSFSIALNPQITKSFAQDDKQFTCYLIYQGAKFIYFLMLLVAIPIIFETPIILRSWLGEYPEYTELFLRLTILVALIDKLSDTLTDSLMASGNIKGLHIMVGCVVIPVIPISYWLYYIGMPAYISYVLCLIALSLKFIFELFLARNIVGVSIEDYYYNVIEKVLVVTILALIVPFLLFVTMDESVFRLIVLTLTSLCWTVFVVLYTGLTLSERKYIIKKIKSYSINHL